MPESSLFQTLLEHAPLSDEEQQWLQAAIKPAKFEKGEWLLRSGNPCRHLIFISEGLARHFFYTYQGEEKTTWFSQAGDLVTDFAAFTTGGDAVFNVEALEPTAGFCLSREALYRFFDRSKAWERLGRLMNQHYLIQLIERSNDMALKSARQRYAAFQASHAHLFNRVPLKHIASYLGITLETLSRLRSGNYQ